MRHPVATNSIHLQSTCTEHLQRCSNLRYIWNPVQRLQWCFFCGKSQYHKAVGCFHGLTPLWVFSRILGSAQQLIIARRSSEEILFTTGITQGHLGDSPCFLLASYQNDKMKSWTDPASSFP